MLMYSMSKYLWTRHPSFLTLGGSWLTMVTLTFKLGCVFAVLSGLIMFVEVKCHSLELSATLFIFLCVFSQSFAFYSPLNGHMLVCFPDF